MGTGCLATKININFFGKNGVLNIFHITIFSKKKNKPIFSNITEKNYFWGHDHFSENGVSDNKNGCDLFYAKWGTEYGFKKFSS